MKTPAKLPPLPKTIGNKQIMDAARPYLTRDESRFVLLNFHCHEGYTVATDGRRIIAIEKMLCRKRNGPAAFDRKGAEVKSHGNYPNWKMVMPSKFHYWDEVNVKWLHEILMQMSQDNMFSPGDHTTIKLCINSDGKLGVMGNPITTFNVERARVETMDGKPVFSYGWKPNPKMIAAYNGYYLIQALHAARLLGDEMVTLSFIDDPSPMQIKGRIHRSVIMPCRINS